MRIIIDIVKTPDNHNSRGLDATLSALLPVFVPMLANMFARPLANAVDEMARAEAEARAEAASRPGCDCSGDHEGRGHTPTCASRGPGPAAGVPESRL